NNRCSSDQSWIWSYGAAISVPQDTTPQLSVTLGTSFMKCGDILCTSWTGTSDSITISIPFTHGLAPRITFETNPLVGSVVLQSTVDSTPSQFSNGDHSYVTPGSYIISAVPPEDYVFDHWECPDQFHHECGDPSSIALGVGRGVPSSYPPAKS